MPIAIPDSNSEVSVTGSQSLSLSFHDQNQNEAGVNNAPSPFVFSIPRDTSIPLPPFEVFYDINIASLYVSSNTSNSTKDKSINLLVLNGISVTKKNVSIHYQIKPYDETAGFFAAMTFGGNPYLNSTYQRYDLWQILCPWSNNYLIN